MRQLIYTMPLLVIALGCGTMANLDGKPCALICLNGTVEPRIYGGVKNDLKWGGPFLIDVPLSTVADTVTIPIVIRLRRNPSMWKVDHGPLLSPAPDGREQSDSVNMAHPSE